MHATLREDESFAVQGHWAEYTDESARVFRYGTLSGVGLWHAGNTGLIFSLDFKSGQDGSRQQRSFLLTSSAEPMADTEFLRRIQAADVIQPLIYNELVPRRLGFAEFFESQFLDSTVPRAAVPFVNGGAETLQVDGRLAEPEWRVVYPEGVGVLESIADGSPGTRRKMLLRYDGVGLYMGLQVDSSLDRPRVTLSMTHRFDIPLVDSPR